MQVRYARGKVGNMVTLDDAPRLMSGGKYEFSFKGLSGDEKPVNAHEGMPIANGSTFLEMDTMGVSFYDESSGA